MANDKKLDKNKATEVISTDFGESEVALMALLTDDHWSLLAASFRVALASFGHCSEATGLAERLCSVFDIKRL
jgi:hypothetical protein